MADAEEPGQDPNLDDLWSQLDPETQQAVINLFINVCYSFLVYRTNAAAAADKDAIGTEPESLN